MTSNQTVILIILVFTMAMFLWGRWRHDMVAVGALLACVLTGLIAAADAFIGFGHPAVISVACILILSRGLQTSGAVNVLVRHTLPKNAGPTLNLVALVGLGAVLSGFMNNVGAMALLMPVAIQLAERLELPPGRILMPLAFGTILGGMTTMIGTPPNLIVSGFRAQSGDGSFGMFDFTPVGLAVALSGVIFIAVVGWRLVPMRKQTGIEAFETGAYTTEVRVSADSKAAGMVLHELETILDEHAAQVVGLVRNEKHLTTPRAGFKILANDILIIEAEAEALAHILSNLGLNLEEADTQHNDREKSQSEAEHTRRHDDIKVSNKKNGAIESVEAEEESSQSDEIILMEFVVRPESTISGRSAADMRLRTRYGLNLLAVSREGSRAKTRLRTLKIQPGDLLLLQGTAEVLAEFAADFGCVPLANRELHIPDKRKALIAGGIMAAAVGGAAFGLLPAAISFALGVLASMVFHIIAPRAVYDAIDWPVIVLLGALIPVAGVLDSTGTADLMARFMIDNIVQGHAIMGLALILIITMFLSDLMNNAATAAVMCPIAIGTATALGVNADSFLMAVAIGASCAFLTPIGHQNNTLILGPGGFRFGDYWQLGLPLEILVITVSIPLLLIFWPL
ncbi:SLC13 family permease [Nitrosomonas supralitoralis]|uniref:SLC13 family permease n=1 Tax=Nitrosomonas supralitoralis TaxID=2116706 RepID=A0A2P7NST1_9PROT|nr:SLC13 family permease [Nitrosomonas supralitoralis]PSJ16534.1 SLC13 family permease [Nitrosomonas supralitoralis]